MPRIKQKALDSMKNKYDNVNLFKDKEFLNSMKGKWSSFFNSKDSIVLEIGMGNGGFLRQIIEYDEENEVSRNYIGFEIKEFRVWKALNKNLKYIESGILKLINSHAEQLDNIFAKNEIGTIYLNFSDPWPKDRHAKNRLTSSKFLKIYKNILKDDGDLFIKTDNNGLYEYSLETLQENGFKILEQSNNLHAEDFLIKKFVTEFEEKWLRDGKKINYIHARKQ